MFDYYMKIDIKEDSNKVVADFYISGYAFVRSDFKDRISNLIKKMEGGSLTPYEMKSGIEEVIMEAEVNKAICPVPTRMVNFVPLAGVV